MKKEYMKPAMCVVTIQQQHIICASSDGPDNYSDPESYDEQSIIIQEGSIEEEELVW